MKIAAPRLDKRVTIQQRNTSLDQYGQRSAGWVDITTVWAGISPFSGVERLHAMQVNSEISTRVKVRYQAIWANPTAVDGWRVVYNGRFLNINTMINDGERNHFVTLLCTEGVNDG